MWNQNQRLQQQLLKYPGNITAQNANIEGEVKGKIEISELLVLKAAAIINGDIVTGKLVVEPGAVFNGKAWCSC